MEGSGLPGQDPQVILWGPSGSNLKDNASRSQTVPDHCNRSIGNACWPWCFVGSQVFLSGLLSPFERHFVWCELLHLHCVWLLTCRRRDDSNENGRNGQKKRSATTSHRQILSLSYSLHRQHPLEVCLPRNRPQGLEKSVKDLFCMPYFRFRIVVRSFFCFLKMDLPWPQEDPPRQLQTLNPMIQARHPCSVTSCQLQSSPWQTGHSQPVCEGETFSTVPSRNARPKLFFCCQGVG